MSTITKKELTDRLAQSTQVKTVAIKAIVQNLLDEIIAELAKGNRLEFRGFGVFEPREHAQRMALNPKTFERIHVPAKRIVRFKAGRVMKQKLNGQDMKTQVPVRK